MPEGGSMEIRKVETDKKEYMPLLLLADEQEDMIDRYLESQSGIPGERVWQTYDPICGRFIQRPL